MSGELTKVAQPPADPNASNGPILQSGFDDLYSAVYAVLDDAKTDHDLVKLYKGSHAAPNPHPVVTDVGAFFYQQRRGLFGYACHTVNPDHRPALADLDAFDSRQRPRIPVRAVFDVLFPALARPGDTAVDVLGYVADRTHRLGAYRGGSSGYDEETRAFAAAHFHSVGVPARPEQVLVFCGGAKGAFMAFCAAIMCRRRHDDLHHLGGLLLTPAGYYQSLRLIPPLFGGTIHVTPQLTAAAVADWLQATASRPRRCIYVPLVNNADGAVLTPGRAQAIAHAILTHNATHPRRPVYVLADDVYTGSYLNPARPGIPIAAVTGADLGAPHLGRMSDWTLSVVTPSKTFALPTARVAFATTTNPLLRAAIAHYRTVLSQGRVPQASELTAAAAICLTPQHWINQWNSSYRITLADLTRHLHHINTRLGYKAVGADPIEGGWYVPLRLSPRLLPTATSSVDAFAALLHYGGPETHSGIALLPGELFGHHAGHYAGHHVGHHVEHSVGRSVVHSAADLRGSTGRSGGFLLRGTLAANPQELRRFITRLGHATAILSGPDGPEVISRALRRARSVADLTAIVNNSRY